MPPDPQARRAEDVQRRFGTPGAGNHAPTSFLERGVAVPCTTPVPLGGRLRPARRGPELVIADRSGGRGGVIAGCASRGRRGRPRRRRAG